MTPEVHARAVEAIANAGWQTIGSISARRAVVDIVIGVIANSKAGAVEDLIGVREAAQDLLDLHDKDQRTVGYRDDRWNCLREALAAKPLVQHEAAE